MTKSNLLLLLFSFCISAAFTSCSKDDDTPSTPSPAPAPTPTFGYMSNGRLLTYSLSGPFSTDTIYTVSIVSQGSIFKGIQTLLPSSTSGAFYLRECSGTVAFNDSSSVDCSDTWFKGTTNAGDSWTFTVGIGVEATHAVLQKNVSVTTPAGTFICDKMTYHEDGTLNTDTFYYNNTYSFIRYEGAYVTYYLKAKNY